MKDHLVALLEAVRLSQERLVTFVEEDQQRLSNPRDTVSELCNILGHQAVIEAMVHLASAAEVRLAPLGTAHESTTRH